MKDFSQNGEQAIILKYFGVAQIEARGGYVATQPGTVLDIGANDGVTLSNSRALVELGWNAVLVEPAEIAFRKLQANNLSFVGASLHQGFLGSPEKLTDALIGGLRVDKNPLVTCINAAITELDGPIDFWDCGVHLHKGDTSLLSTTKPEELARWKRSGEQFTKTTVRGITFETLLKECGLLLDPVFDFTKDIPENIAIFDFITIDAEGADFSILKQIDLTAVGCRMLCVEVNARGDAEFTAYAAKHGMRLHWSCTENRIYTKS